MRQGELYQFSELIWMPGRGNAAGDSPFFLELFFLKHFISKHFFPLSCKSSSFLSKLVNVTLGNCTQVPLEGLCNFITLHRVVCPGSSSFLPLTYIQVFCLASLSHSPQPVCLFETRSHSVVQAGLKLSVEPWNSRWSCISSPKSEDQAMCYPAPLANS